MDSDYELFIKNIKLATNIDLSQYKETQMKRRLTSLRDKNGYRTFYDFFIQIKKDRKQLDEFLDRMTINVTEFYRDPKRWRILEEQMLPMILEGKDKINIWSAACSTGEEPYTLAMVLNKIIGSKKYTITATDIDEAALKKAQFGEYSERSLKEVPYDQKKTYFSDTPVGVKVSETLQKNIIYKKHNLLADSYGQGWDLIVCRNVMIYFTEEAKKRIYHMFAQALHPGGILFVGSTEQIFNPNIYGLESINTFFYRKK
jgi:chemotaxis protein methyltransferase CheR